MRAWLNVFNYVAVQPDQTQVRSTVLCVGKLKSEENVVKVQRRGASQCVVYLSGFSWGVKVVMAWEQSAAGGVGVLSGSAWQGATPTTTWHTCWPIPEAAAHARWSPGGWDQTLAVRPSARHWSISFPAIYTIYVALRIVIFTRHCD